jgi:hypothetical protein
LRICLDSVRYSGEQTEKALGLVIKAVMGRRMSVISKDEKVLERAAAGLSRVGQTIASIPLMPGRGHWKRQNAATTRPL